MMNSIKKSMKSEDFKKNIKSIPDKLRISYEKNENVIKRMGRKLKSCSNVILSGCGDKYIIPLISKYFNDEYSKKSLEVCNSRILANYMPEYVGKDSAIIFLTVSGKTIDVIDAIKKAKEKNAFILVITQLKKKESDSIYSVLKGYKNYEVIIPVKDELITHPSTSTSLTFLSVLNLILTYSIDSETKPIDSLLLTQLINLPESIHNLNKSKEFHEWCKVSAEKIKKMKNPILMLLGDGPRYAAAKKAVQIQLLEQCGLFGNHIQSEEFVNLIIEEVINKDFGQLWIIIKPRASYVNMQTNNRLDEIELMIREKFKDDRVIILEPTTFITPKGMGKKNDIILTSLHLCAIEWLSYYVSL
jgi:fructoselysine-6-P-deglycase FrlB-like protein